MIYDRAAVDSYSTFGRSFDLFGDGSVRLVYTPGHTHGHQSRDPAAEGPRGAARRRRDLLPRTLEHERRGLAWTTSTSGAARCGEIQLYRRENPDALIIPATTPSAWAGARAALRVAVRSDPQSLQQPLEAVADLARAPPRGPRRGRSAGRASVSAPSIRCASGSTGCCSIRPASIDVLEPGAHQREAVARLDLAPRREAEHGRRVDEHDPLHGRLEAAVEERADRGQLLLPRVGLARARRSRSARRSPARSASTTALNRSCLSVEVVIERAAGDAGALHDLLGADGRVARAR